ncbi:hypothetical protein LCGC14_1211460 [marine sediment metagenome]|uniref:Uncharacterized protein n=1 Tax=marine sediment metagenome TaxID=412755 RepID=A0A0F9M1C0_9ZZZZ
MPTRMNQRHRLERRRVEAVERQTYYDSLSTQTKIDVCKSRPGESRKELTRLNAKRP